MYPAAELQKGIKDALTAIGVRAYDRVPPNAIFPYADIPEAQILDDGNTCDDDAFEAFATIHLWSRDVGQVEAKRLTGEIREVLKVPFPVAGFEITNAQFQSANHFTDADGLSAHSVLTFRYLIQAA